MAGRRHPSITNGHGALQLTGTLWAFETINAEQKADANMIATFGKPPTAAFLRHACRGEIEAPFAHGALDEADIIIVSNDTTGGLRGFCCVKKNYPKAGYLYVDLICSAPGVGGAAGGFRQRNQAERAQMLESGRTLLQTLKDYCTAAGWRGIFLRAVSNVVTYYYYLGWRFIKNCGEVQKDWVDSDQRKLKTFARANPKNSDAIDDMARKYFARYGDFSWYKGITGAELVEGKDEAQDDHDALGVSEYKTMTPASEMLMKYDVPDQGYLMLWCPGDPTGARAASSAVDYHPSGAGGGATSGGATSGGATSGGRRRSKRSKRRKRRKNTKKKRRRTRRGRSRKRKRRRRTRRGRRRRRTRRR